MKLVERDYRIFREIERWRVCLSRHIQYLTDFTSQRICDRRLSLLIAENFLTRRIVIYGVPSLYLLTWKSKTLILASQKQNKIRLDQIAHDVVVLDVAICFMKYLKLSPADIKTEKQLHQQDGFSKRVHRPDFIFTKDNKTYCVEVELSLKSKSRLDKNLYSNFHNYDYQVWVVGEDTPQLSYLLEKFEIEYPNIKITNVTEVKNGTFEFIK